MSHLVDFFTGKFGTGGNIIVALIFIALALVGLIIALRGRQVMVLLSGFCGTVVGILGGAMVGLLCFDSFILMMVLAFLGGVALLLLLHYVKSVGYFISISALSFFISYVITSDMYITSTRITSETLLLLDLVIGITMGILAAIKSKYLVSVVTSASGGMIAAISIMVVFGCYFSDWRTWLLAFVIAVFGMYTQIRTYDIRPNKRRRAKHTKRK